METVMKPQRTNREAVAISRFDPLAIREGSRSLGDGRVAGAVPKGVLEILLAARGDRLPTAELLWGERLPQNGRGASGLHLCTSSAPVGRPATRARARGHRTRGVPVRH
jgi:hypothetical protein